MNNSDIMAGWQKALEAGELRFPRCEGCRSWNWYPLPRCRVCGSSEQRWTAVAAEGTLYSWTRVHRAFGSESGVTPPYITGIVDVAAAPGVRLVCLNQAGSPPPEIGKAVNLVLEQGSPSPRWLFRETKDY